MITANDIHIAKSGKGYVKITDKALARDLMLQYGGIIDKGWLYLTPSHIYTTKEQWAAFYNRVMGN